MSFDCNVSTEGDLAVLELHGDIDGRADEPLNEAYASAIEPDPKRVMLRFGGVTYINSTGIALIVGLLAEARRSDREVLAAGLTDHYKEIFEITRISDFITIVDSEEATDGRNT